ncbi:GNAT family N-acetyltransferase [Viridibacillus sp. YIM B01967]|uniref:GNAT family N-acetyltransferase n=1 Tax=Viridibacillus soli TaxID=2798301 RepID=A0ABS1H2N7_9BACL|nr:GNAT family N-acetyltransferase [Viridibacillus soli]MBK3493667.1 GNAT family N-acetyltransferase [Viridibacillus soli]
MSIEIHDVTKENEKAVSQLCVAKEQKRFIETPEECLQEAKDDLHYHPVGLYADQQLVGFAMYGFFPHEDEGRVWIDRFLIDAKFQGHGFGKNMLQALITKLTEEYKCRKIYLSVYEDNPKAIYLYQKFGFQFNGELDVHNEKIMVKAV